MFLYNSPLQRIPLGDSGGFTAFDPDAIAFLAACTGDISIPVRQLVNNFFIKLKADGNYAEIDRMSILCMPNEQNGLLNAKNPASPLSINVGATFTPLRGFTGNGTTSYMNFSFTPSVNGVKYTLNSGSIGGYFRNMNKTPIGGADGSGASYSILTVQGGLWGYLNSNSDGSGNITFKNTGFFSSTRANATQIQIWEDGVSRGTFTNNSTSILAVSMYLLAYDAGGAASQLSTSEIAFAYAGSGLIDQAKLSAAVTALVKGIESTQPADVDATAFLNACTGVVSPGTRAIVNNFFVQLKADGNFAEIDRMNILCMPNEQNGLLNAKTPAGTLSINNGAVFAPKLGFTGNGTTTYINFNFVPSTNGVKFTQQNASLGAYVRNFIAGAGNKSMMGVFSGGGFTMIQASATTLWFYINSDGNGVTGGSIVNTGFYAGDRQTANSNSWVNGVKKATATTASAGFPTTTVLLLARNNGATPGEFTDCQIAFAYVGSGNIKQDRMNSAVQALVTSMATVTE